MATIALADIRDIVNWLKSIEESVGFLYKRASESFVHDKQFNTFLMQLEEDEKTHAQFMSMILEFLPQRKMPHVVDIVLDRRTKDSIEAILKRFDEHLRKKHITKSQILEYIARAEFSELNPVFLYIVSIFGEISRETENITNEIQRHLSDVQEFIDAVPKNLKPSIDVRQLPLVREQRFLVVDDHESLRNLVASLLVSKGTVETVSRASEGLEKIKEHFYNGIISDVQMPVMDGIEFYRQSIAYDSRLSKHFLFYSGDLSPDRESFLKQNHLLFLRKPFGLSEFMDTIDRVLMRQ